MLLSLVVFVLALALLVKSSDWLIGGAEEIGLGLGVSPFVIGVTIVAMGTSLPELASSVAGVLAGDSGIVTGNVIGSNVANICLVLGLTAIVGKGITMDEGVMDFDIPILAASAVALWAVTYDNAVTLVDGLILVALLVVFLLSSFLSRPSLPGEVTKASPMAYLWLLIGGVGVYFGASYTVSSVQEISAALGISSGIVAMSAVAIGTSLPEVLVSLAAARRGNAAMAVGNVIGSNVFNSFGVLGIPALIDTVAVPPEVSFSLAFMLAVTVILGFLAAAANVSRWEGATLLLLYTIFIAELF